MRCSNIKQTQTKPATRSLSGMTERPTAGVTARFSSLGFVLCPLHHRPRPRPAIPASCRQSPTASSTSLSSNDRGRTQRRRRSEPSPSKSRGRNNRPAPSNPTISAADAAAELARLTHPSALPPSPTAPTARGELLAPFAALIKRTAKSRLTLLTLQVYEAAVGAVGLGSTTFDAEIAGRAVRASLSRGDTQKAVRTFDEAVQRGCVFDAQLRSSVISGLARVGWIEQAVQVKAQAIGRLERFAYQALIETYAKIGDYKKARAIREEMVSVGLKAGVDTDAAMARALMKASGSVGVAIRALDSTKVEADNDEDDYGMIPSAWSRSVAELLFEDCLDAGNNRGAAKILKRMTQLKIRAGPQTFNALIRYFAENRDSETALSTLQSMKAEAGVTPNAASFFEATRACVLTGESLLECGDFLQHDTVECGVADYYPVWNARLILAARYGEDIVPILKRMADAGIAADQNTLLLVLEATHSAGQDSKEPSEWALKAETYTKGFESVVQLLPSKACMDYLLKIWASVRERSSIASSERIVKQMIRESHERVELKPDSTTFFYLIESAVYSSEIGRAVQYFGEMERRDVKPNEAIFDALIRGFGAELELAKALGVWNEMKEQGIEPSKLTYKTMVDACLQHPRGMNNAIKITEEMISSCGPTESVADQDALLQKFRRASEFKKAITDVFTEAPTPSQVPINEIAMGAILNACGGENHGTPTVQRALQMMKEIGVTPEQSVIDYLSDTGRRPRSKSKNHDLKNIDKFVRRDAASIIPFLREERDKGAYAEFEQLLTGQLNQESGFSDDPIMQPIETPVSEPLPPPTSGSKGFTQGLGKQMREFSPTSEGRSTSSRSSEKAFQRPDPATCPAVEESRDS